MGCLNGGASLIFRMMFAQNVPCWLSERHASALLRLSAIMRFGRDIGGGRKILRPPSIV